MIQNFDYGSVGYKDFAAARAYLFLLDPHGKQIEEWQYDNLWPKSVSFGELDYSSGEPITISVTFQYDKATMIDAQDTSPTTGTGQVYSSSEFSI